MTTAIAASGALAIAIMAMGAGTETTATTVGAAADTVDGAATGTANAMRGAATTIAIMAATGTIPRAAPNSLPSTRSEETPATTRAIHSAAPTPIGLTIDHSTAMSNYARNRLLIPIAF